ncbi:MAG: hypothetical protein KAG56_08135 [Sulfurovaceae bacterium]|nr:hypothetical protein [Sulfurovaceae bacterium]
MKKMLLINSFVFLSISSLVANATLDEMYKEMKNIANEVSVKEVAKEVTQPQVTPKNDTNQEETESLKLEIADVKSKIENLKITQKNDATLKESTRLKSEIKEFREKIKNLKITAKKAIEQKSMEKESITNKSIEKESDEKVVTSINTLPTIAQVPTPISVEKVQTIITDALTSGISIPVPPKVPTVISINGEESIENRSIKFSKRIPPGYTGPKFGKENIVLKEVAKELKVGEVNAGKISAYLRGELLEVADVEKRLKDAGFTILTSAKLDKKGKLVSVVFTNKELITMASKPNRGFASTLRVLINQKEKKISITNPLYLLKGFLQDDFDKESATKILTAITSKFDNLQNSGDQLKFQLLPKYQFMSGLPYYKDSIVVGAGDNLVAKLKDNKRVFFEQKLDNGSVIVGIALNKRTNGFLKKIGSKNAAMLPLLVLIEDGKATILDPKFYISIMYPRLTMSEFMKIATIPDAMVKDSKRVFR